MKIKLYKVGDSPELRAAIRTTARTREPAWRVIFRGASGVYIERVKAIDAVGGWDAMATAIRQRNCICVMPSGFPEFDTLFQPRGKQEVLEAVFPPDLTPTKKRHRVRAPAHEQ